jgi:hypothetical protein
MEIIVVGTHEYEWAVRIFGVLFERHWGETVTYWGDREPSMDVGLPFRQVPAYKQGIWTWGLWYSDGLKSILREVGGIVAVFLPDHWPCAPVDKAAVLALAACMDDDVVRGNLAVGTCLDLHGDVIEKRDGYEIVQMHPGNPHCSIMGGTAGGPALWNAGNFADVLESGWSLWGVEKKGTDKMAREWPRWRSIGIRPAPLHLANGLGRHRQNVSLGGLSEEDRKTVRRLLPNGCVVTE